MTCRKCLLALTLRPSSCYFGRMFGMPLTIAAGIVAIGAAVASWGVTRRAFGDIERAPKPWDRIAAFAGGVLSALLVVALQRFQVQFTDDVVPSPFWHDTRGLYHAILIVLLVAATCTDLDSYYIPDSVTIPGMVIGVLIAWIAGDLQTAHVWVDWNQELPQFHGPYLPAWMSAHPHLHGLAWSVAGLVTGVALTWSVRGIAGSVLGMEALGFGDVMLMGMVGSFLGWQPTVVAFLLAPFCALLVGLSVRLLGGKSYIPYGPYLALASLTVMFTWRWIWMFEFRLHEAAGPNDRAGVFAVRRLFGDWLSLLALAGIMFFGLLLLLGLGRLYRLIPGRQGDSASVEDLDG